MLPARQLHGSVRVGAAREEGLRQSPAGLGAE